MFNDATGTHWFFILSSVIGRHSYGHVYTRFRRKPAAATLATLFDNQQGIFYMHFSIDRTVHTKAFDKPVVDHWLERKIAQTAAGSTEKDRSDDRPLQRRARYRLSYIPLLSKYQSQWVNINPKWWMSILLGEYHPIWWISIPLDVGLMTFLHFKKWLLDVR